MASHQPLRVTPTSATPTNASSVDSSQIPRAVEQSVVTAAVNRTRRWLLGNQHADGYWCGELQGDSILESEYILLLAYLGQERSKIAAKAAAYLVDLQLPEGGWSLYPGGKLEISGSVKAYFALKLTGHDPDAEYMQRAKRAILTAGGADRVNSFTRFYLALLGQISYDHCPAVPPEMILLPTWSPINIYRMSAWSRTIMIPLSIMWAQRPVRELDDRVGIGELFVKSPDDWPELRGAGGGDSSGWISWERFFRNTDRALKWLERRGINPLRARALRAAERWMVSRFVASDGLGAIFPPIVWSVVALRCLGYSDDSLEVRYCHEQLRGLMIEDRGRIRLQPCKSPVWDTALTLRALAAAGIDSKDRRVRHALAWLLKKEVTRRGDWSQTIDAPAGGWFFEHHNDFYPDVDDTAMVLMALSEQFADSQLDDSKAPSGVTFIAADRARGLQPAREQVATLERVAAACERGRRWTLAMQNRDGGWGAFDKDNDAAFLCHVPFADHNAMIDPSTPDLASRALEALGKLGARPGNAAVDFAVSYIRRQQESDGSWQGRWGVNYIYGTWQCLTGLAAAGISIRDPAMVAGAKWLLEHQREDGGWGETPDSYEDTSLRGQGRSTATQTSWGLLGLLAVGYADHPSAERAVSFLLQRQRDDGTWDEPEFTGTGFPRVFYLKYHMYAIYFPLMALARWGKGRGYEWTWDRRNDE